MAGVIALVSDLMFGSRIREAAAAKGAAVRTARGPEALLQACREELPALVFATSTTTACARSTRSARCARTRPSRR
jgi:hypothetical protein